VGDVFWLGKQGIKKRLFFLLYEQIWKNSFELPENQKHRPFVKSKRLRSPFRGRGKILVQTTTEEDRE